MADCLSDGVIDRDGGRYKRDLRAGLEIAGFAVMNPRILTLGLLSWSLSDTSADMARDSIRELVGRWRERTGLGIEDLARLLGAGAAMPAPSRQTIYRWIAGEQSPDPRRFERLAKVLGCSVGGVAVAAEESVRRAKKECQRRAKEVS